jgi:hypothetical protein
MSRSRHRRSAASEASKAPGERRVDEGAVGRQAQVEAERLAARRDVEQVLAQQRLAAREDERAHVERLEVVHHREHLAGLQLAGEVDVGGDRVAVHARQVAAPDQVPDHHRAGGSGRARGRRGLQDLVHEAGDAEHVRRASGRSS